MKRWPLHPQPRSHEILSSYIRRLADCYGVSYKYFLQKALSMSPLELQEFRPNEPSLKALQHLSNGTGVSVRRLKLMTFANVWKRLMKELNETMLSDK